MSTAKASGLVFDNVVVRFGRGLSTHVAVDGVTLEVPPRTIVGLLGESGSGKSTLARTAMGLTPVTSGRILYDGSPCDRKTRVRDFQMVYQDPSSSLNPRMTVGRSIAEAIRERQSKRERASLIGRLLDQVELDPSHARLLPHQLSGGQKQRVALARALAGRPRFIVADEITSALDVSVQASILNLLKKLHVESQFSMLFIAHDLAVVRYVSELTAVMLRGRVVEFGRTCDVLDDPQHPYTKELISARGLDPATSGIELASVGRDTNGSPAPQV